MSNRQLASFIAAAVVVASPLAFADNVFSMQSVDPMRYRSAFEGYRPLTEEPVGSWSEANGLVGRIGGWRSYANTPSVAPTGDATPQMVPGAAAASKAAGVPTTTPASAEKPAGHSGHKNPNP